LHLLSQIQDESGFAHHLREGYKRSTPTNNFLKSLNFQQKMQTKRIFYTITTFAFLFITGMTDTTSASNSSKNYSGLMEIVKPAKVDELSENPAQKRPIAKKTQINLSDLSTQDPLKQPLVIYDGPEGRLFKSKIKADFLETFKPEIDIFQNKSSQFDKPFFSPNSVSDEPDKRLEIFRLKQNLKGFNYGLEYRYVGKNLNYFNRYKNKTETTTKMNLENDQEGLEIWGEKSIRSIGLKTFFSRFWDNVDGDPELTRILTKKYGLEMKYKMDLLPISVSFSHFTEETEDTFESEGLEYRGNQKKTYNSSLRYYGGKTFEMKASSSYSLSHDLVNPNKETQSFRHGISSSIRPGTNLTITPRLSFGEYQDLCCEERKENPSASLSITYRGIFDLVDLSLRGGYSQTRNTDRSLDTARLKTSVGLRWDADYSFSPKIGYSLDLGYDKYLDKINQNSSYQTLSTSFKLKCKL